MLTSEVGRAGAYHESVDQVLSKQNKMIKDECRSQDRISPNLGKGAKKKKSCFFWAKKGQKRPKIALKFSTPIPDMIMAQESELKETFRVFSKDDEGCISAEELKFVMTHLPGKVMVMVMVMVTNE